MTVAEMQARDLLAEIIGGDAAGALEEDELIFERGVVDSMHLVELVALIEARCGFLVEGDELQPSNFESIQAMGEYIDRKLGR
jgi:acyl carrier protein